MDGWLIPGLTLGVLAWAIFAGFWAERRREARDRARLRRSVEDETHIPPSLHPVIDPDICIGSLACISACPEGDILGIVDGSARLISGAHCIGHGRCAAECPVDAIKLVFGTSTRGVDLPDLDAAFESSRRGVHVIGELAGMGLIRNAMLQGVELGTHLGRTLTPTEASDVLDVVIVGGGPAGLAAGVTLQAAGRSVLVLEQEAAGGAVVHYPRHKIVMTERVELPQTGRFGRKRMTKAELLRDFEGLLRKSRLPLEAGVRVVGVEGELDDFTVLGANGETYRARRVVLTIGRRGSPRRLEVPGEETSKVTYRLVDPEQYAGARVLVVGGGDSAVEAACALAEARAEVTLAHRGRALTRCRAPVRAQLEGWVARGAARVLLDAQVKTIGPDFVELQVAGEHQRLPNGYVIVQAGGDLPLAFLARLGIQVRRHFGEERARATDTRRPASASTPPVEPEGRAHGASRARKPRPGDARAQRTERALAVGLALLGLAIVAVLAWTGRDYYPLSRVERLRSPLHAHLRSSGPWGSGVGIAATLFMLSNFIYPLRKRLPALKGVLPLRIWLLFHVFVGFMSPLVIAFHAAFQSNNTLATGTALALATVVLTGVIGRFLYGLVPSVEGRVVELAELRAQLERLKAELAGSAQKEDTAAHREAQKLEFQIRFYRGLRRLLAGWRVLHVVLAIFLVGTIIVHVGVSLYLGYGWSPG